jgi:hypothetical protein
MTADANDAAIAALQERIDALASAQRPTPAEVIAKLLPTLEAARARGVSFEALLPLLREAGISLTAKTVREYMSRARRAPALAAKLAASSPPPSHEAARFSHGSRGEVTTPPPTASPGKPDRLPGRFQLVPDTEKL